VEVVILIFHAPVGIDVSGSITASFSPVVAKDWTINPGLELSAHVDKAVARTFLGGIDVTGRARDEVNKAIQKANGDIQAKLASALNIRKEVEGVWKKMNSVYKLTDDPPTWLRITPKVVTFGQLGYTTESIESGLALDLNTQVFLQDTAPEVLATSLPDLNLTGQLSGDFDLSLPVEVTYAVINGHVKKALSKDTIKLPEVGAWVGITGATIEPYGDGILLTVDFNGKKGLCKSASGRLYIVGVPGFDATKAELRVDQLQYTAATESLLLKSVEWLAHSKLLDAMKTASVVNLNRDIENAKTKANQQLEELKKQLPKEVGANVLVKELKIDRLAFAKERAFAIVNAKGKMSAQLQK
jgi:hypothetical protein